MDLPNWERRAKMQLFQHFTMNEKKRDEKGKNANTNRNFKPNQS